MAEIIGSQFKDNSSNGFEPKWHTVDGKPPPNVRAFVTYRSGGFSSSPYDSNNLAFHVGDDNYRVKKNREALSNQLSLSAPVAWLSQVHGDRIITDDDFFSVVDVNGSDANAEQHPIEADGVMSCCSGLICTVMTADCLPVLFCNKEGNQVAAIHAGWRGLANGILKKAVMGFKNNKVDDLLVFLGPAISQRHYEVGDEVISALEATVTSDRDFFSIPSESKNLTKTQPRLKTQKYYLNMNAVAKAQLRALGVTNISGGERCTYTEKDNFYSYRRDGKTGRMASLIWLAL